jgi:transcription termination factor 2
MDGYKTELIDFFEHKHVDDGHENENDLYNDVSAALLSHQRKGIEWMTKREKQGKPQGGILADDMGLGKTLSLLMLIFKDKNIHLKTLIVCPLSLMNHWIQESQKHKLNLNILKYYKSDKNEPFHKYNAVVTSYNTIVSQFKRSSVQHPWLFSYNWHRIILDEAHTIKNHKTLIHRSICGLKGTFRWCVTGTPIHNRHWDMYAMINFLQCSPFNNKQVWKIMNDTKSCDRIKSVVNKILLKRNKFDINLDIPQHTIEYIYTQFNAEEKKVYDKLKNMSNVAYEAAAVTTVSETKTEQMQRCIWLILKLRQMCCHPYLMIKTSFDSIDSIKREQSEMFNLHYLSSKCRVVCDILESIIRTTTDKVILVSQWVDYLLIFAELLKQKNISTLMYHGKLSLNQRAAVEKEFNSPFLDCRVLLMSIKCGGVGLNLIGANHLIMLEPHWNPQIELQAQDRINRLGQRKCTKVYKILNVNDNSIELHMNSRQKKKLEFINSVFDRNSPTFDDIKDFFGFK